MGGEVISISRFPAKTRVSITAVAIELGFGERGYEVHLRV